MSYTIRFYTKEDDAAIKKMVLDSYEYDHPAVGVSRIEFSDAITPAFNGYSKAWEHTVGVVLEDGKVIACIWNEGEYDGCLFFLYDKKERAEDPELARMMIKFAKTYAAGCEEDRITRTVNLLIPAWNKSLKTFAEESGFTATDSKEECLILPFTGEPFDVTLPEGYSFADGNTTPDFFLSNVHMHSFNYGNSELACDKGEEGFHRMRQEEDYRKNLDLCILDPYGMPVTFANIWYRPSMPYAELEPLACVWWERRKGLATAILHEAANRLMKEFPECTGLRGGDQEFYRRIGFKKKDEAVTYSWKQKIFISWDPRSLDQHLTV